MPNETLDTTLIAILATLVGALIWVVKALMTRSDKLITVRDAQVTAALDAIRARDSQIESALGSLTAAVEAFGRFEQAEQETHGNLVREMATLAETQRETLVLLREIKSGIDSLAKNGGI